MSTIFMHSSCFAETDKNKIEMLGLLSLWKGRLFRLRSIYLNEDESRELFEISKF